MRRASWPLHMNALGSRGPNGLFEYLNRGSRQMMMATLADPMHCGRWLGTAPTLAIFVSRARAQDAKLGPKGSGKDGFKAERSE